MKHSIVCWDSSFRNFFHLLPSLASLSFDRDDVEIIFIEQRTREVADRVCRNVGTKPVSEVVDGLKNELPVDLVYLDEPDSEPYHPGRLLNVGLEKATGDILSTMDADILLHPDFMSTLNRVHEMGDRIFCMHRYNANFPCGTSREDWTNQIVDYDLILNTCSDRHLPIPEVILNKAPLLSARREHWEAISGYDSHRIFSTAYTLFGRDISLRFKLLLGDRETPLPVPCVHPWHPTEVDRGMDDFQILYGAQQGLMNWSQGVGEPDAERRTEQADQLYAQHRDEIEQAISIAEAQMIEGARNPTPVS